MKQVGLIGVGRMGKVLTGKLAGHVNLKIFDHNEKQLQAVAQELGVQAAASLEELAGLGTIILVVPDREVISLIKDFNQMGRPLNVINVATNVATHALAVTASPQVRCIGAKFVAQAREMALGAEPVIIVDERPGDLAVLAQEILASVGKIILGQSDCVTYINTQAAEKALTAAVLIEETLRCQPYANADVIKSAIRQVAAGILKGYADDDLGPFAREIVRAIRSKLMK
ncbi:NAD(P)-binding domain-containing protein [Sporomusa malonica]|uniref:NAD binding domain of 6-phosphogluconate dehydrogenase n=1 Tax=Sporomusa malonica TaxID=112901 RepID=A0A1W2CNM2_9FIRM|nr:NAD(P)-binding domain-containing protein [Sporomusa malonica]SMC86845.1 NAD binding domain of 6-phosphogluconate dehydrogenase [Sporomusa malonica]